MLHCYPTLIGTQYYIGLQNNADVRISKIFFNCAKKNSKNQNIVSWFLESKKVVALYFNVRCENFEIFESPCLIEL